MTRITMSCVIASLFLVGCLGGLAPQPGSTPAAPSMVPSHPPATAAQWTELEARAASLATEGTTSALPPRRLQKTGMEVATTIDVERRTCYAAGIAWAFGGGAAVSVAFEAVDGGPTPNEQMGRTGAKLDAGGGVVRFCADNPGRAILSVSATTREGFMAPNELLEYAVAVGARKETTAETAARRSDEKARVAQASAQMEANIAAAEARDRRNLAERCSRCEDELALCRTDRAYLRRNPPRGVSVQANCEQDFRVCSFGGSHFDMNRSNDWPCGNP